MDYCVFLSRAANPDPVNTPNSIQCIQYGQQVSILRPVGPNIDSRKNNLANPLARLSPALFNQIFEIP